MIAVIFNESLDQILNDRSYSNINKKKNWFSELIILEMPDQIVPYYFISEIFRSRQIFKGKFRSSYYICNYTQMNSKARVHNNNVLIEWYEMYSIHADSNDSSLNVSTSVQLFLCKTFKTYMIVWSLLQYSFFLCLISIWVELGFNIWMNRFAECFL